MNLVDLLGISRLDEDLDRLESSLCRSVRTEDPFLDEVAGHLIGAGGKRVRPALGLAAAVAGRGRVTEPVLLGGVAVELVHLASLYHDDVLDEATTRRNVASVNARWGNLVAIVAGDFLLARAAGIAASLGTEVAGLLAATLARLCEGEVSEVRTAYDPARSESAYLAAIAGKTASLMATACRIGALTAGLDRGHVEAVTTFGESFGMVFQIHDDIRDVVASDEELGKEGGQDLVKGIYTLPVLRALADPDTGPELRAVLGGTLDGPSRDKARVMVAGSGAIASSIASGRLYADRAAAAAACLGEPAVAGALANLGYAILDELPTG